MVVLLMHSKPERALQFKAAEAGPGHGRIGCVTFMLQTEQMVALPFLMNTRVDALAELSMLRLGVRGAGFDDVSKRLK